jgi:SsrA-binding protein
MGKKKKKKAPKDPDVKIVCRNRRAQRDYRIESTMEAGLVLIGTEVKSLRQGKADLGDSYAAFKDGELFLTGSHIAAYDKASHFNHDPLRARKLLLHKHVIDRLGIKIRERGFTIIPLEIYFRRGIAKVLLGLAKGRKQYDNRQEIRREEERREMRHTAQSWKA